MASAAIQWPHWLNGGTRFFGSGAVSKEAGDCEVLSKILPFAKIPLVSNAHPLQVNPGIRFLRAKVEVCAELASKTGRGRPERLDLRDEITDQRPRHNATGRDGGLLAAVFEANGPSSRFGGGQECEWQPLDFNPKKHFMLFSARDRMPSFLHVGGGVA